MSAIPQYVKIAIPTATPTARGELGLDANGNLFLYNGTAAVQVATGSSSYSGVPTRVVSGSTHVVPLYTQEIAMFNVQVDGDIQFDGDWAFTQ
jgi:hypothetical protein